MTENCEVSIRQLRSPAVSHIFGVLLGLLYNNRDIWFILRIFLDDRNLKNKNKMQ